MAWWNLGFKSPWLHSTRPSAASLMAGHPPASTTSLTAGNRPAESNGLIMSASAPADSFFVYILRCADDSLYVGHTSNVHERVKVHNDGRGALWTATRRPVTLAYQEFVPSEKKAIARERQIKRWTQQKKAGIDFRRISETQGFGSPADSLESNGLSIAPHRYNAAKEFHINRGIA